MDIGLILSIAAGVVLGGLILIYRARIVDKGRKAAELTADGAKVTGRGIYAIRWWVIGIIVIIAAAATFALTRAEKSPDHWLANQQVKSEMRAACREEKGAFKDGREYMYCYMLYADMETTATWLYHRSGCKMHFYRNGERTGEEYVDACAKAAFQPAVWHRILQERRERKTR